MNDFEGVVSNFNDRPLEPAEVHMAEARARLDTALGNLVTMATLVLLVWGIGGFIVWAVNR